jgi:putative DNA primase/helicase
MRFEEFARGHGLIINYVIPHKWIATPTEDHPKKRNGRYKFMGDHGWVQNWATMQKPVLWKAEQGYSPNPNMVLARKNAEAERAEEARKAAARAGWMLKNSFTETHPYLAGKGFPDEKGAVWLEDGRRSLIIPMRINGRLSGAQLINDQGEKKFLKGQVSKGASFVMDAKGVPILCEGFATALSIRKAMIANKIRYSIYVCFSAGNMEFVAGQVPRGFLVADNDASHTGENFAKRSGKPYWISPTVGEDFNDYHQRVGDFQAALSLKQFVISNKILSST